MSDGVPVASESKSEGGEKKMEEEEVKPRQKSSKRSLELEIDDGKLNQLREVYIYHSLHQSTHYFYFIIRFCAHSTSQLNL